MSGWGSGWGATPWGGFFLPLTFVEPTDPPDDFDLFCFYHAEESMGSILEHPDVSTIDDGGQFQISADYDLLVQSGDAPIPSSNALLVVDNTVPQTWTLQVIVTFNDLPVDFTNLTTSHLYFGGSDGAGLSAGLFIAQAGLAYSGAVALNIDGDLVLGGPLQVLPGTSGDYVVGTSYTFRLAVDFTTSTTYVFATQTAAVPFTGHRLIAIVPGILTNGIAADGATISARGTAVRPTSAAFDQFCMSSGLQMPNLPPRADAGRDQSLRACTVGMLDGTASFDPEGGPLTYSWRLIDAPSTSSFAFSGADGFSLPELTPTGFTDHFYSAELGSEAVEDAISVGDVLLIDGVAYSIAATGVDGNGFYAQFSDTVLPDNLVNATYRLLRQRALTNPTSSRPTFYPDVSGIYKFDLVVFDGQYYSLPATTIVNVVESQTPRGIIPDLGFIWQYLSDFWKLVEDRERIQVMWESMAQVAAAELMTLWQVDYSKSLRDVQRTMQRRWLHYDLKLPEPLPSLTTLRRMYGGVTTNDYIAGGGVGGISGTVVEILSPAHAPLTIAFPLANPYTAETLRNVLRVKLQGVDARYEVTVLTDSSSQNLVRITAPFHFSIGPNTTNPLFDEDSNVHARGTLGLRLTPRTYRVDYSLEGLDIKENDLLFINGEGYKISRVVDDPADDFRFQRIIVQSDLPIVPGAEWAIPSHVTSRLLNFYGGLLVAGDEVLFEAVDSATNSLALLQATAVGAVQAAPGVLGVDVSAVDHLLSLPTVSTSLAYVLRRTRLPIGGLVVEIPGLQEFIKETNDSAVLRQNIDYFIEEFRGQNSLRFVSGNVGDAGDVWEEGSPPHRMWAEVTYIDNRPVIEENFGIPAEFTLDQLAELDTDLDYLSAVRGLWYSYLNGPTMFNLRAGTQILLGLPFAEAPGVIEEIRTDFSPTQGRLLVRDSDNTAVVRSYSFPSSLSMEVNPSTGAAYVVGDSVRQFAPLVQGSEVIDYVKDASWFQGILNQGSFLEVEKFHKFMVRVDSAAFNLSALLFVRSFTLRVKPTYTFPFFVVRSKVGDTEVSVEDSVEMRGRLILHDGACFPNLGVAQIFDDFRAAGGGVRNQFDSDNDPDNAPPTFPVPDAEITWGFDKKYLCPEDDVGFYWCLDHSGGAVPFDLGFVFDDSNSPSHHFSAATIASVPAGPTGFTFSGSSAVTVTGDITSLHVAITGGLGGDPGDYEFVIVVDGVDGTVVPVTVGPGGLTTTLSFTQAVVATDVITLRLRPASGGARTPEWTSVSVTLYQEGIAFQFDSGLPAGTYCFSR